MPIESPNSPVTKIVELDLEGMSPEQKTRAKNEAGRIIIEEINSHLDRSVSPVSGGDFKVSKKDGERSILFEFGDMRDSIEFKRRRGNKIEIGVFDKTQTPKAFGHNTDFRGHPSLSGKGNKREFIPGEEDDFKGRIQSRVNETLDIIREAGSPDRTTVGSLVEDIEVDIGQVPFEGGSTTLGSLISTILGDS